MIGKGVGLVFVAFTRERVCRAFFRVVFNAFVSRCDEEEDHLQQETSHTQNTILVTSSSSSSFQRRLLYKKRKTDDVNDDDDDDGKNAIIGCWKTQRRTTFAATSFIILVSLLIKTGNTFLSKANVRQKVLPFLSPKERNLGF